MANLYYYLGHHPWAFDGVEYGYMLPPKCVGTVDLRRLRDQATPNAETEPSFFACSEPLDSSYHLLGRGDCREILRSTAIVDTWETITGFRPAGNTLADILWDHLTSGSDPEGAERVKPLMPTTRGMLELHLGGHSLVRREKFSIDHHPHGNRVRSLLKRDFRRMFEHANRSGAKKREQEHPRKVLDFWCEKYGINADRWREFVPSELQPHIPGVLKHETTISDDFNRADGDSLGADWTEVFDDWDIGSNRIVLATALSVAAARHNTELSSDDHYSQIDATALTSSTSAVIGAAARFISTTTRTWYEFYGQEAASDVMRLRKRVAGTGTTLGSDIAWTQSLPDTLKCEANGSDIAGYLNGTAVATATDTAITGYLRCGVMGYKEGVGDTAAGDAFEAADLTPEAGIVYTQLERTTRGMFRGIYTGGGS